LSKNWAASETFALNNYSTSDLQGASDQY